MRKIQTTLVLMLTIVTIIYAQDGLDPDARAVVTSSPQLSMEIWNRATTDYFSENATISDAFIDIQEVVVVIEDQEDCIGFTSEAPSYQFNWRRDDISEKLPLTLFAIGTGGHDLTLVIREPDGDWFCVDDYKGGKNPLLVINDLRSGPYTIWVGNKTIDEGEDFRTRLYVYEGDYGDAYDPEKILPPCCDDLNFSNPASSDRTTVFTYIESKREIDDQDNEILSISADILFQGEVGDNFLVEVLAFDMETDDPIDFRDGEINEDCPSSMGYCETERLQGSNQRRRDYSVDSSRQAVEFTVPLTFLESQSEEYEIRLIITDVSADEIEVVAVHVIDLP